jgi:HTH-type transcriptional regulator/antitoxin HigA
METFTIKHIENEKEYRAALARIDELINAEEGTPEYNELILIGDLVLVYEEKYYPIAPPDPIELLKYKLDEGVITFGELKEVLPNRTSRSLIFSKARRMPLNAMYTMIRKGWVPAESFFLPDYFQISEEVKKESQK